jgi:hypothetical protein
MKPDPGPPFQIFPDQALQHLTRSSEKQTGFKRTYTAAACFFKAFLRFLKGKCVSKQGRNFTSFLCSQVGTVPVVRYATADLACPPRALCRSFAASIFSRCMESSARLYAFLSKSTHNISASVNYLQLDADPEKC